MIGYQRQLFYALFLIAFESAQAQHPADWSGFAANNVFAHSGGNVGVIVVRRTRQQALSVAIGRLGVRKRAEFFLGDERSVVGAKPADQRKSEQRSGIVFALL